MIRVGIMTVAFGGAPAGGSLTDTAMLEHAACLTRLRSRCTVIAHNC